jgi:hypothetical protein
MDSVIFSVLARLVRISPVRIHIQTAPSIDSAGASLVMRLMRLKAQRRSLTVSAAHATFPLAVEGLRPPFEMTACRSAAWTFADRSHAAYFVTVFSRS